MEFTHAQTRHTLPGLARHSTLQATDPEQPCANLTKLARYIRVRGMDWNARRTAEALTSFFDTECRRHKEFQEQGLFAALARRSHDHEAGARVDALLRELKKQHAAIAAAWKALRRTLSDIAFCRAGVLSVEEAARFSNLYLAHIATEDEYLRPLAAQILGVSDPLELVHGLTQ